MKYVIVIEDTPRGVRALAQDSLNGVMDNPEVSLAAKATANLSLFFQKQVELGVLRITNEMPEN